ncbi:MAG: hypothetical protein R3Y64_05395 [Peptostreptococcaceae bacterium]
MNKLLRVFLLSTLLVGCGSDIVRKSIEQGQLALANKEFDKALASFNLAIDNGSSDDEIIKLNQTIEDYLNIVKFYEKGEFEEAKKLLSELNDDYTEYSFRDEIDKLKEELLNEESGEEIEDKTENNEV